jgi:hypothetical protein
VELTEAGQELLNRAPEVAQGVLVLGLEALPTARLSAIAVGLAEMVRILGAHELPPKLLLSPEVNVPKSSRFSSEKGRDAGRRRGRKKDALPQEGRAVEELA